MSNVVDELIIALKLDPSQFDAGQRKALDNLRKFSDRAGETAQKASYNTGSHLRLLFAALQHPVATAQHSLVDLASQSRRTGESIEAGALSGAAGMRVLLGSALLALGAFKGIQALLGVISKQASFASLTGFMAQWTGVSPEWMTRLSSAAQVKTGVPQEQTQNWLMGLQSSIQAFVTPGSTMQGVATPLISALMRMGINPLQYQGKNGQVDMSALMGVIEDKLKSFKPFQRAAIAQQLGMPLLLMQFLSMGHASVQAAEAQQKLYEVTKQETTAALKLQQAERQVTVETDKLARVLLVDLEPALVRSLKAFSNFLKSLIFITEHPHETTKRGESKLWQLWENMLHGHWHRQVPGILSPNFHTNPSSLPSTKNQSFQKPPTPREMQILAAISQGESGQRNIYNYKHAENPSLYTASGYWQITDTNWRAYAPLVGINTNQYPSAISASERLQEEVALYMYRKFKLTPWNVAHGGSIPVGEKPSTLIGTAHSAPPIAHGGSIPVGEKPSTLIGTAHSAPPIAHQLSSIKAGSSSTSTVTHNSGGNTMTNHINITVPPGSNGLLIGSTASNEIKRQVSATNFNTGYE